MTASTTPTYVLGHSEDELGRLGRQAKLIDPITRHYFERAGIGPGMRVLDIGSGAGHVAHLVADMVGPGGQVIGVDRAPTAIKTARERTEALGLRNVTFVEGDPGGVTFDKPFDAAVGRYVLMFNPDPVAMLRAVAGHVRPGGVVVFQEPDWAGVRSFPRVPLFEEACRWIVEAIGKNGADPRMGVKLHATFLAAGLPAPSVGLESLACGGEDQEQIRHTTEIVGTLLDSIVKGGIATAAEVGIETLADRIAAGAQANGGVMVCRGEMGAWCRKAG